MKKALQHIQPKDILILTMVPHTPRESIGILLDFIRNRTIEVDLTLGRLLKAVFSQQDWSAIRNRMITATVNTTFTPREVDMLYQNISTAIIVRNLQMTEDGNSQNVAADVISCLGTSSWFMAKIGPSRVIELPEYTTPIDEISKQTVTTYLGTLHK